MQFLIIAVAMGTGVGVNTYMARKYALGRTREADAAAAVTVLWLYYKLQNFFFIPLFGLQTCIVPLLSYNCAAQKYARCRETVHKSPLISASLMLVGAACFILLPVFWLLSLIGLNYTWLAFPVAETAAGALGYIMYRRQLKVWK